MRKFLLFVLLFMLTASHLAAGSRLRALKNWIDSADVAGADTNFVRWPDQGFIASINTNFVKSRLSLDFTNNVSGQAHDFETSMSSKLTTVFSLGVSYRGWGLSYSRDFSGENDEEFSFCTYGQKYGAEFHIRNRQSFSGSITDLDLPDMEPEERDFDIRQKIYIANVYYVFNSKRFSLPAALSQTVIQRRSAGSWLALFNYYHSRLNFNNEVYRKFSNYQLCVGGGYAYNWVFGQEHCLLHASVMPSVVFWHRNKIYQRDQENRMSQDMSFEGLAHLSFVYNFSRYLAGITSYYNVSWTNMSDDLNIVDHNWSGRVFIGVRF